VKTINSVSIVVVLFALLGLGLRAFTIKIPPGQTGVLNAMWTRGLVRQDYPPGFHWDLGPLHTWTLFDTTVQTLNRSAKDEAAGPLNVTSADGATVTLDVTVKYRIKDGRAWSVCAVNGPGEGYKAKVHNEAINVLRTQLGALKTEEFYDPRVRQSRTDQMEAALRERLALLDVDLVKILIRDLKFNDAFEARIRDKTLAQQDVELNQAKTETAKERGKTNEIIAQTKAKVVVIDQEKEKALIALRADNDKAITQLRADASKQEVEIRSGADLYAAQLRAQGELEVKKAEAEAERMRREALAVPGADVYVALELAKSLKLGELAVSTQAFDPLDIDAVVKRLVK
jgi:regulator of protease activity HflC (stomatin/prohibitin superfamily)